jgi:5'-deoxynucleotidase
MTQPAVWCRGTTNSKLCTLEVARSIRTIIVAEFTFQEMMRTGHVTRWQIVRTARQQTVAEHMYRVWIITVQLCRILDIGLETASSANIWALYHDMPEVLTGDIATPAKEAMRKALPDDDPVRNIELAMSDTYRRAWEDAKRRVNDSEPTAYEIVKLADLIEARTFLNCEHVGEHALKVYWQMCSNVDNCMAAMTIKYPTFNWANIRSVVNSTWNKT